MSVAEGNPQQARRHYETAIRNHDADGRLWSEYAIVLASLGIPQQALDAADRAIELFDGGVHKTTAVLMALASLIELGELDEARQRLQRAAFDEPKWSTTLAWPYKLLGDHEQAEKNLQNKNELPPDRRDHLGDAIDYCVMGFTDQCIQSIIRGIEERDWGTVLWARIHPLLEGVRQTEEWSRVIDLLNSERGIARPQGGGSPLPRPQRRASEH